MRSKGKRTLVYKLWLFNFCLETYVNTGEKRYTIVNMDLSRYGTGVLASTIAEFVSSFYFVFCSCVATTLWPNHTESSVLFIAVLSGLSLAVVCDCSLEITKAFANPVVTIALYLTQRLDRLRFVLFIPAQIVGGNYRISFFATGFNSRIGDARKMQFCLCKSFGLLEI